MKQRWISLGSVLLVGSTAPLFAQGRTEYFNVESPQVKPITIARLAGHDYLLVCNTPDNSLEIWDTDESILPVANRFKARARVGLEPVSVKFNPVTGRAYTANFLGDSITMVALTVDSSGLRVTPVQTTHVGDEPMDIAFSANGFELYVTHNTLGTYGWRDAWTLNPMATGSDQLDLVDSLSFGIKEPRAVAVSANTLFVLGFKGGFVESPATIYDFDVYAQNLSTSAVTSIAGLGSTNFNMCIAGNGDLWVVGGEAQNRAATGNVSEATVADDPTGFVKSTIYLVPSAGGATVSRDLNDQNGSLLPVARTDALAQPVDVLTYEPALGVFKVYVAAYGSDRVGVLTPNPAAGPYTWPLTRIALTTAPGSTNPRVGPRGLAVRYTDTSSSEPSGDPGDRIYVLNRLDNSVSVIDPTSDTLVVTFALKNDPTPQYIRDGREFLYSADISTSGFVSCASCHMDGRTDSLPWKLGTPGQPAQPYPPGMADGELNPTGTNFFAVDKGSMMTQTLQGLLNFEVEPAIQGYYTNAPYHWRGDRADFTQFNGAFVALLKAPDIGGGNGLTREEMETFRTFINSIQYPPNPHQPDERIFSGSFGTADLETDGSGGARGLKLFHIHPIPQLCDGRSCVQCHALVEGSNNRGTVPSSPDLLESAATRGLFQREMRADKVAGVVSPIKTGEFGLAHLGGSPSLNAFIQRFNQEFLPIGNGGLQEVKEFMREFDFSVAPLVGRSYTIDRNTKSSPTTTTTLDLFEGQVRVANVGLAVHLRVGSVDTGYWFDVSQTSPVYVLEGTSTTVTRAGLLALIVGARDRAAFIATPLGTDRRAASMTGTAATLTGPAPTSITLQPAVANTAYAQVSTMTKNWDPANTIPGNAFVWGSPVATPPSLKSLRLMQHGLIIDGLGQQGVTTLRHEPPRRFAVAGTGILPGATLLLYVPDSTTAPNPSGPLSQITTVEFSLPLFPTDQIVGDGLHVWQTAAEIEPTVLYTLLLGGRLAPGVSSTVNPVTVATLPEPQAPGTFSPLAFNFHYVKVRNPDGLIGDGGWQVLTAP